MPQRKQKPFLGRLPAKHWLALNTRRGVLIKKLSRQGLGPDEQAEFEALQFLTDCHMRRESPLNLTYLASLERRLRRGVKGEAK